AARRGESPSSGRSAPAGASAEQLEAAFDILLVERHQSGEAPLQPARLDALAPRLGLLDQPRPQAHIGQRLQILQHFRQLSHHLGCPLAFQALTRPLDVAANRVRLDALDGVAQAAGVLGAPTPGVFGKKPPPPLRAHDHGPNRREFGFGKVGERRGQISPLSTGGPGLPAGSRLRRTETAPFSSTCSKSEGLSSTLAHTFKARTIDALTTSLGLWRNLTTTRRRPLYLY